MRITENLTRSLIKAGYTWDLDEQGWIRQSGDKSFLVRDDILEIVVVSLAVDTRFKLAYAF